MKDTVVFHLSKHFPPLTPIRPYLHCAETLYEQIKRGKKTSEWRDFTPYWVTRFFTGSLSFPVSGTEPQELTAHLKVHRAWFVEGYPKRFLPRLEADIKGLVYHPEAKEFPAHCQQFEIKVANVQEVTAEILRKREECGKVNLKFGEVLNLGKHRMVSMIFTFPKKADFTKDPDKWRNET